MTTLKTLSFLLLALPAFALAQESAGEACYDNVSIAARTTYQKNAAKYYAVGLEAQKIINSKLTQLREVVTAAGRPFGKEIKEIFYAGAGAQEVLNAKLASRKAPFDKIADFAPSGLSKKVQWNNDGKRIQIKLCGNTEDVEMIRKGTTVEHRRLMVCQSLYISASMFMPDEFKTEMDRSLMIEETAPQKYREGMLMHTFTTPTEIEDVPLHLSEKEYIKTRVEAICGKGTIAHDRFLQGDRMSGKEFGDSSKPSKFSSDDPFARVTRQ